MTETPERFRIVYSKIDRMYFVIGEYTKRIYASAPHKNIAIKISRDLMEKRDNDSIE